MSKSIPELKNWCAEGLSYCEMGRRLGVSHTAARNLCLRRGLRRSTRLSLNCKKVPDNFPHKATMDLDWEEYLKMPHNLAWPFGIKEQPLGHNRTPLAELMIQEPLL